MYLFYSKNSVRLNYEVIAQLHNAKCAFEYKKVDYLGPNALDFQIVTYIGLKIGSYKNLKANKHNYVIISHDKGYHSVVDMWTRENINVSRWDTIDLYLNSSNTHSQVKNKPISEKTEMAKIVQKELKENVSETVVDESIPSELILKEETTQSKTPAERVEEVLESYLGKIHLGFLKQTQRMRVLKMVQESATKTEYLTKLKHSDVKKVRENSNRIYINVNDYYDELKTELAAIS